MTNVVVKAVIHPAIGIGRVGEDTDNYYLGPETVNFRNPPLDLNPKIRDDNGRIRPQAARFRVYGVNVAGDVICELSAAEHVNDVAIAWDVHLANSKAEWYKFEIALDIPEAKTYAFPQGPDKPGVPTSTQGCVRRNLWKTTNRNDLIFSAQGTIEATQRETVLELVAPSRNWVDNQPPTGEVFLGRAWREEDTNRLIVVGGKGHSKGYEKAYTFGNNDYWYDDVSDGPITATVTYKGTQLPVSQAWFVVSPPNYGGSQQESVRTMWDLMRDGAIQTRQLKAPAVPSFTNDIYPIFSRLSKLQWVNSGFAAQFGWDSPFDFTSDAWIRKLRRRDLDSTGTETAASKERRRVIYNNFRQLNFLYDGYASNGTWPPIYGDSIGVDNSPRSMTALTPTQLKFLNQWVDGIFNDDWDTPAKVLSAGEEADALTRAQLDSCLADAFHPGCEITWPVRSATMYSGPFRFAHANGPAPPQSNDVTTRLNYDNVTAINGPLYDQRPGDISRWMAIPWQTDTASCRSGYKTPAGAQFDPSLPSFWPARVPNQVLTLAQYNIINDPNTSDDAAKAAFDKRDDWDNPLDLHRTDNYVDEVNNMVQFWSTRMGAVVPKKVEPARTNLPHIVYVADRPIPGPVQKK